MKYIFCLVLLLSSFSVSAADQYVNAKIERIETCNYSNLIFVFLKDATGTVPSSSDGCSNDVSLPHVRIYSTQNSSAMNDALLSLSLTAFAAGKVVRVRYDDSGSNNYVRSIAVLD